MIGHIYLADGTHLVGEGFGAEGAIGGELVFNTAMTGYQEMLTDPSYKGQILMLTYPLIGNYGTNDEDNESEKIHASGLLVTEYSAEPSNWRSKQSLGAYLKAQGIVAVEGVDTRFLTRKIRKEGSMRAVIASGQMDVAALEKVLQATPDMDGLDLASQVSCDKAYTFCEGESGPNVAVIDCGIKGNMLRSLQKQGANLKVFPSSVSIADIEGMSPDAIFISNGPGDPAAVPGVCDVLAHFIGKVPMFGICLGHQLLARSIGAKTFKLPFGHHGANHPVQNLANGKIEITSQNHGFAVDGASLRSISGKQFGEVEITHMHLSDATVEGFRIPKAKLMAIQYHPESCPGPHDAAYLFKEFIDSV